MEQDSQLLIVDAYRQFLDNLKAVKRCGPPATYYWYELPDEIPREWVPYGYMLDERCREVSNSINELGRYISGLEAWKSVLDKKNEDEKLEIVIEFVRPIAILALNHPYVIRSRFIYSTVHLCHQANKFKASNWIDDLPLDEEIYFDAADKYGAPWASYGRLKKALEKISNKEFQSRTQDFRNKYIHRYSLGIEIGVTEFVKRNVGSKGEGDSLLGLTRKFNNSLDLLVKHVRHLIPKMGDLEDRKSLESIIERMNQTSRTVQDLLDFSHKHRSQGVKYIIGGTEALKLSQLIPILSSQYLACIEAFREYQKLIYEHISEIK
jgi:hypothetical protein